MRGMRTFGEGHEDTQDTMLYVCHCTGLVLWLLSYHVLSLAGDLLLTASYLSYVGCFTRSYREDLLNNKWIPFLKTLEVRSVKSMYLYHAGGQVSILNISFITMYMYILLYMYKSTHAV